MKITVAVPTIAGRTKYLESCLATCVSQDMDDLEILVSDNSEGEAQGLVNSLQDSRIRYVRPPQYLPMSAHWDFVLEKATGDAITFIGDDDGLMPDSIRRLSEIYRETGNVPVHHSLCNYYWNDYVDTLDRNTVVFFHDASQDKRWIASDEFLLGVCKGLLRYVDGPMVYHNFVPRQLMQRLSKSGVFFRRSSPDVYSAVAVAANVDRFLSVGEFLTISGQGARANGASVRTGGKDGIKFLKEMQLSLYRPRYKSRTIQLQLLDTIMEVAEEFSMGHLSSSVDFEGHLWRALGEARAIPGLRSKASEILEIGRIAMSHGVMFDLFLHSLSAGMEKVRWKSVDGSHATRNSDEDKAPRTPKRVGFDSHVTNVYEASLAVDALLKQRTRHNTE